MDNKLIENYVRKLRMIRFGEITEGMARFDKTLPEYRIAYNIDQHNKHDQLYKYLDKFCK